MPGSRGSTRILSKVNQRNQSNSKARLLSRGRILVPHTIRLPVLLSRSTAGPGAGGHSLFFCIGGSVIRLEVVRDGNAPLRLDERSGRYIILEGKRVVADGVGLAPAGLHAPGQAFINLHNECRFRCAFCTLPLQPRPKGPTAARWLSLISGAIAGGKAQAVAITTGIPSSPARASRDIARLVSGLHRRFPDVPIGVEPYTVDVRDLLALRKAGARELKLNLQCATPALMERVCPGLDRGGILKALEAGVGLFGRGRVCSNIILGLGEKDSGVLASVRELARIGVAVNLRPLRVNALNRGPLRRALGRVPSPVAPARMLRLARAQKKIFGEHGLAPSDFLTMCHRCTACDIEPFRDV